jgi:hypothetical protein
VKEKIILKKIYTKPKPSYPSVTATSSFDLIVSYVEYGGSSSVLKQVCAIGRSLSSARVREILIFWESPCPLRFLNPPTGTYKTEISQKKK